MPEAKAQASADQDPSMEEILQSIRRIIAEDEQPKEEGAPAAPAKESADISSDVLELTEMVNDAGDVEPISTAMSEAPIDVMANIESALSEEVLEQEIPASPMPMKEKPPTMADVLSDDHLLSDIAAAEAVASFRKLTPTPSAHGGHPGMHFRSGLSVEDLVIEMLRPELKQWLDTNLPSLVERIVEREVRRLSGE